MGVSVSHPLGRTAKAKYIQTVDTRESSGENDNFLKQSSQAENTTGKILRGRKGTSKRRNEALFFQFKTTRSNPWGTFDSLDTIDSRKSVPFAVLPEDNITLASTSSAAGEGDLTRVPSAKEGAITEKKSCEILFLNDEGGGNPAQCAGRIKEKNMGRTRENVDGKVTASLQEKLEPNDRVSSSTKSGELEAQFGKQSKHVVGADKEICCGPQNERISANVFMPSPHGECANGRKTKR